MYKNLSSKMLPGSESGNGTLSPSRTTVRTLSRLGRSPLCCLLGCFVGFYFFSSLFKTRLVYRGVFVGGGEDVILFVFPVSIFC